MRRPKTLGVLFIFVDTCGKKSVKNFFFANIQLSHCPNYLQLKQSCHLYSNIFVLQPVSWLHIYGYIHRHHYILLSSHAINPQILIAVSAGCEVEEGYSTIFTRTYPEAGKFVGQDKSSYVK